jgi:hypothetical protein
VQSFRHPQGGHTATSGPAALVQADVHNHVLDRLGLDEAAAGSPNLPIMLQHHCTAPQSRRIELSSTSCGSMSTSLAKDAICSGDGCLVAVGAPRRGGSSGQRRGDQSGSR